MTLFFINCILAKKTRTKVDKFSNDGKMAYISGKGWQIRTDVNENNIKPVKFVNPVPDSSEDEDDNLMSSRILPNYLHTDQTTNLRVRLYKYLELLSRLEI